jgi:hypothetical protein
MVKNDELMSSIMRYGRGNIQDFVARSQSMSDVISYIQAERFLEINMITSFVTSDMIHFERRNSSGSNGSK